MTQSQAVSIDLMPILWVLYANIKKFKEIHLMRPIVVESVWLRFVLWWIDFDVVTLTMRRICMSQGDTIVWKEFFYNVAGGRRNNFVRVHQIFLIIWIWLTNLVDHNESKVQSVNQPVFIHLSKTQQRSRPWTNRWY